MKPLLDVLVILDALEKEGSFAAASAKLFKTPSALSYTIHRLESDLNIQLLDRSGHRARFTPYRTDAAGERAGSVAHRPRTGDPGG
ncbi:hypothetical protein KAM644c_16680 [Klebsiella quasipneumoniae subsp. quasipneumoniae]|uniref:HTH lysR-type domain-containing protein n=1 Tax=Klebsiella quasipneumoniae subsp. quasipneumoniae TaxID=1667327 RepID=A0AAN1Y3T0_9ENTR|nr:hypothetical protein KAM622c_17050 [Klebsiella quasipneumoniae subsp. quasipneumoniae]BDO12602.1 hypothetical protein KAM644c_16680 [Klebsiella quasipneumoniae subsp. quasipneumoniae]BDO18576.1 hypothetical protein KAM645c_16660 [Klebsiella quasipneumoniae subsp. quasipneumoniae]